jgi:hypothetical protein
MNDREKLRQQIKDLGDHLRHTTHVDWQLEVDKSIFGFSVYQIGENGEKIRINPTTVVIEHFPLYKAHEKRFWLSVIRAYKCMFSRRYGHKGKIIFGYSVCLRLFNRTIL